MCYPSHNINLLTAGHHQSNLIAVVRHGNSFDFYMNIQLVFRDLVYFILNWGHINGLT